MTYGSSVSTAFDDSRDRPCRKSTGRDAAWKEQHDYKRPVQWLGAQTNCSRIRIAPRALEMRLARNDFRSVPARRQIKEKTPAWGHRTGVSAELNPQPHTQRALGDPS